MNRRRFILGSAALAASSSLSWSSPQASQAYSATLIVDLKTGQPLKQQGPLQQGHSPCSTFKVPLAVMGFDSGLLQDATHPTWQYRPEFGDFQSDHKLVNPTSWLADSIVWYSQELTRKLGMSKFQGYLKALRYGNQDVKGGLTQCWLCDSLQISVQQQVEFLRQLAQDRLTVSPKAQQLTRSLLPRFKSNDGWDIQGKTGSGWLLGNDGHTDKSRPQGWFVGLGQKDRRRVAFAYLEVHDKTISGYAGPLARQNLLHSFLD